MQCLTAMFKSLLIKYLFHDQPIVPVIKYLVHYRLILINNINRSNHCASNNDSQMGLYSQYLFFQNFTGSLRLIFLNSNEERRLTQIITKSRKWIGILF